MTKYMKEIIATLILSFIILAVVAYISGNLIASISVFTAVLVTINFILNRYEMRNETIVDLKIDKDDEGKPEFSVSLVNTGGKTIYFHTIGLKTKNGILIDFDEDLDDDEPPSPPEKPKTSRSFFQMPTISMPVFRTPFIKPIRGANFYSISPGDARKDSKKVYDVILLLQSKNFQLQDTLEIQGIFIDKLNCEHTSEWKQFNLAEILKSAKKKS